MKTYPHLDKRIERAKTSILFYVPFFFAGAARLPVVWDEQLNAEGANACTDGKRIRFSPQSAEKFSDGVLRTVVMEEVGHCLFGHMFRCPPGVDWGQWNKAADQELWNMFRDFAEIEIAKGLPDPFPFDGITPPNRAYKGMAAEAIVKLMEPPQMPQDAPQRQQGPQGSGGQGKTPQQGSQPPPPGDGKGNDEPRSGLGDFEPPPQPKPGEASESDQKADWESTLIQSVTMAKQQGKLPAGLERFVHELVDDPPMDWAEVVRNWLREQCNDDYNWMRPNVRYDESGFILPTLDSERVGAFAMAIDTSGSIDPGTLAKFKSIAQFALDGLKPVKLLEICCDASITQERDYRPGDTVEPEAPGGGGTSFVPVIERLNDEQEPVRCLVYLTDLEGSFPSEEPAYPVLWVAIGGKTNAPFGTVVPLTI